MEICIAELHLHQRYQTVLNITVMRIRCRIFLALSTVLAQFAFHAFPFGCWQLQKLLAIYQTQFDGVSDGLVLGPQFAESIIQTC